MLYTIKGKKFFTSNVFQLGAVEGKSISLKCWSSTLFCFLCWFPQHHLKSWILLHANVTNLIRKRNGPRAMKIFALVAIVSCIESVAYVTEASPCVRSTYPVKFQSVKDSGLAGVTLKLVKTHVGLVFKDKIESVTRLKLHNVYHQHNTLKKSLNVKISTIFLSPKKIKRKTISETAKSKEKL